MARLYIAPGSLSYGPIPGGEVSETFGSNQAEKIRLAGNANVVLDPSFVRGNDWLVIFGDAADYKVAASVVGITISSQGGANIFIPSFGNDGGIKVEFDDSMLDLRTANGGETFVLANESGGQVLTESPLPINPVPGVGTGDTGGTGGTGGGSGTISGTTLDIGTVTVSKLVNASTGSFDYVDDAQATTKVRIVGFGSDDQITVVNASSDDYNFQRDVTDVNDLVMSYTDTGTGATNWILINDILPDTGPVNSYDSALAVVGFSFLTFA